MARILHDSWKRFDRAQEHAHAFDVQWKEFVDPESWETVIEMNSNWTSGVARAVRSSHPKNNLALELGEMFYQLRAALDASIYQAAVLSGGFSGPTDENRVEFPICSTFDHFKRNPINKPPFPDELRIWLESIQPYNIDKVPNQTFVRALQLLHDCARKDRHRQLHLVAAVPMSWELKFSVTPPGKVTSVQYLDANFLEDKAEFISFQFEGATPTTRITVQLNSDLLIEVAIDEIPSNSSADLGNRINWIFHSTKSAIEHIESTLS